MERAASVVPVLVEAPKTASLPPATVSENIYAELARIRGLLGEIVEHKKRRMDYEIERDKKRSFDSSEEEEDSDSESMEEGKRGFKDDVEGVLKKIK